MSRLAQALGALRESKKFLVKAEKDTTQLDARIQMVDVFVRAKSLVQTNPDEFIQTCYQLIDQPKVEVGEMCIMLWQICRDLPSAD